MAHEAFHAWQLSFDENDVHLFGAKWTEPDLVRRIDGIRNGEIIATQIENQIILEMGGETTRPGYIEKGDIENANPSKMEECECEKVKNYLGER